MKAEVPRLFLLIVLVACLVGLLVWARGPVHHHGRYVGSLGGVHGTSQAGQV